MSHPVSTLGVIHTAVSLIPVLSGLYAFIHHRAIDPATRAGKLYLVGLVLSVATSFTVSSTGGINPGHAFGVIVLLVAFGGGWPRGCAGWGAQHLMHRRLRCLSASCCRWCPASTKR
ncbi:hypothetical protein LAW54_16485 [Stenotrophomonas maltophilia]|nr:hypothetical protein [Stenotrophomonas maltophilia]MCD5966397.1 hypothetical protein [Stenotrophomonas maltophilia]